MASLTVDDVDRTVVLGYASRIPWDKYVGAGAGRSADNVFLESSDVDAIKKYSGMSGAAMTQALATDAAARAYPQALLKVLMNITDVRVIQYALTLIRDFVEADPEKRVRLMSKPGSNDGRPYALPFLQLVGTSGSGARIVSTDANPYVLEQAALAAAQMLAVDRSDETAVSGMLAWVMSNLRLFGSLVARQVKVTEVATEALMVLLRNDFLRELFVEERGIERLVPMLASVNTQLLYDATFCLWLLSLQKPLTELLERAGSTVAVARLCRVGLPLKVLRVGLALLANVARNPACTDSLAEICETHVPEVVDALLNMEPRVNDPELLDDLTWLRAAVATNKRTLSSVERYEKEVIARRFEWNAVHSPDFWKENALKFEADGFRLVKEVAKLLSDAAAATSSASTEGAGVGFLASGPSGSPVETGIDDVTLAVALHDLGEFAVNHPNGRSVLNSLGVRAIVMRFLGREEEDDVKQQALLAVSKLMVSRWQFVSGAATA